MKPFALCFSVLFTFAVALTPGRAAVGYVNHDFLPGDSLISNPLIADNNSLNALFPAGSQPVPDGATISLWDPNTRNFLAPSSFSQTSGWTINYAMTPGFGALLHSPAAFFHTFVGEVPGIVGGEPVPRTPPPNGLRLLSSLTPYTAATFVQAIGRGPTDGESVTRLDNATGTYFTTTFQAGVWDSGEPAIPIVGAAFFNLGPVPVPEPATVSLIVLGMGMILLIRRASWGLAPCAPGFTGTNALASRARAGSPSSKLLSAAVTGEQDTVA